MELPECPVCLQSYDGDCSIPRVLACGHTACEACLANLPQRYPTTIRCPACTVLVKYPTQGPSALPKNIDLLRFCLPENPNPQNSGKPLKQSPDSRTDFLPQLWSDEFYKTWKDWVLPSDAIVFETKIKDDDEEKVVFGRTRSGSDSAYSLPIWMREKQSVSLARVVSLPHSKSNSAFHFGYVAKVMNCLSAMKDEERNELGLMLRAGIQNCGRVCKPYGVWGNIGDGYLYLVCERKSPNLMEKIGDLGNGFYGGDEAVLSRDGMRAFAIIAIGICEAMIYLHDQGLSTGLLGLSSFTVGDFGHICIDLNEILVMGRMVHRTAVEAVSNRRRTNDKELRVIYRKLMNGDTFMSPELLVELLEKEGIATGCGTLGSSKGYGCDVWSLACVLIRLLTGNGCFEEIPGTSEEKDIDYSTFYMSWIENLSSFLDVKLGSDYTSLTQILQKCLNFDPECRPCLIDLWRSIRQLIVLPELDTLATTEVAAIEVSCDHCLVLGKLFLQLPKDLSVLQRDDDIQGREINSATDDDRVGEEKVSLDVVDGVSEGTVKSKDLLAHRDSITGLAVGGNFLFSSSFDKTVRVWSLQDFSLLHTFTGHEHRVMALVYVDEEQPLCISADSGSGIFVWSVNIPLEQGPLKKWYDEKDWRYSGIHALAFSRNGYLYAGCGDKAIKAWSLKDCTLSCTMNGHKSVVCALAVCDEVLYSASWDGTIRLWSLSDHSPLTVLGEDTSRTLISVLSVIADRHMLVAAHENGHIKVWRNDVYMKSLRSNDGAILAIAMQRKWLFSGGWDKIVNVQELSGDDLQIDARQIGSIPCDSVITTLLYWQGKLFVGCADRSIKDLMMKKIIGKRT